MKTVCLMVVGAWVASVGACQPKKSPLGEHPPITQDPVPPEKPSNVPRKTLSPQAALAQAKTLYTQRCILCHGPNGQGDGPAATSLTPKPRDYSQASWQASVQDENLRAIIVRGGGAVGQSMMMPGNPDLKDQPEVVDALVQIIRSFKKDTP